MMDARQVFADSAEIKVECASAGWTRLRILPSHAARERVTGFVRSQLTDLPNDLCEQLALAFDELLGNAMEHGKPREAGAEIDFNFIRTERMILFHVRDHGPGFSLEAIAHAAVSNPPEEPLRHAQYRNQLGLRPGGFGILLVKKIADDLIYNETGNEVLLVKYLDGSTDDHS